MNDRLLNFLGIARRAGKLILGMDVTHESAEKGKCALIIISSDISPNSLKEIEKTAQKTNTEILKLNRTKDEIHFVLGKYTAVMSLEDKGFVDKLKQLNDQ